MCVCVIYSSASGLLSDINAAVGARFEALAAADVPTAVSGICFSRAMIN